MLWVFFFTFFTITSSAAISIALCLLPHERVSIFSRTQAFKWNYCAQGVRVHQSSYRHTTLRCSYTKAQPHLCGTKSPISPHLPQYLVFINLMVMNIYYTIVLIPIFLITRDAKHLFSHFFFGCLCTSHAHLCCY